MQTVKDKKKVLILESEKQYIPIIEEGLKEGYDIIVRSDLDLLREQEAFKDIDAIILGNPIIGGLNLESMTKTEKKALTDILEGYVLNITPKVLFLPHGEPPQEEDQTTYLQQTYKLLGIQRDAGTYNYDMLRKPVITPLDFNSVMGLLLQEPKPSYQIISIRSAKLEEGLAKGIEQLLPIINMVNSFEGQESSTINLYRVSRHLVAESASGNIAVKFYIGKEGRDKERFETEIRNLLGFSKINESRKRIMEEITGSEEYIGLPQFNKELADMTRLYVKDQNIMPYVSFLVAIKGDPLYKKIKDGIATFRNYYDAAIQIGRINTEGLLSKEMFALRDVVGNRKVSEPSTIYFSSGFSDVFLGKLTSYGGISIPQNVQADMISDFEILVGSSLVNLNYKLRGFYFDGNSTNLILDSNDKVVNIDPENNIIVPFPVGLASLFTFGFTKEGKPYLSEEEEIKILDRYLLETVFVNALWGKDKRKAEKIYEYIEERNASYDYSLTGQNSDELYKLLGDNNIKQGIKLREEFLAGWQYAKLYRAIIWLGHTFQFRERAERLSEIDFIRFKYGDPLKQNMVDQRELLYQISNIFTGLIDNRYRYIDLDSKRLSSTKDLMDNFQRLSEDPYFHI